MGVGVKEKKLKPQLLAFCEAYLNHMNATQAYLDTHPKAKRETAWRAASKLMRNHEVRQYIEDQIVTRHMGKNEVLARLADIARGDMAEIMDITSLGFSIDLKKAQEKGMTKLIKKVRQTTTTKIAKKPDDQDEERTVIEVELYSAHDAARDIGKHFNLFTEQDDEGNPLTDEQRIARVMAILDAARTRRDGQAPA